MRLTQRQPLSIASTDYFVTHISTVPANLGMTVGLHLRRKFLSQVSHDNADDKPVVLFVHGGFAPSVVAYDLNYKDYSFMDALAHAGFDVFAMTHTGYGASPKPMMDDPFNVDPRFQGALIPHILSAPAVPRYPFKLLTSRSEWDEIESAVKFIIDLRKTERVNLVGWSIGAPRVGGFAAMHPELIDKLVLLGPAPYSSDGAAPATLPERGAPTRLQSRDMLMNKRWKADVHGEDQIDNPEIFNVVWRQLMDQDGLGATWTGDGTGTMRAPTRTQFGWRQHVSQIKSPTLVLLGEYDNYEERRDSWKDLQVGHRVFVKIKCASHFMQFESVRHVLHRLTAEWLSSGAVKGLTNGELCADREGRIEPLPR